MADLKHGDRGALAEINRLRREVPSTLDAAVTSAAVDPESELGAHLGSTYAPGNGAVNAVGDGTTDDTAALTAAIADAITAGVPLTLKAGTYLISDTLPITGNVEIRGAADRSTTIKLADGSNCNMFEVAVGVVGFNLRGISLDGNKAGNTSGHGVAFTDEAGSEYRGAGRLVDVRITNCAGDGIHLGRRRASAYLYGVVSGGNGGFGVYVGEDAWDALILSPNFGSNVTGGLYVNASNVTVTGGTIYLSPNLIVTGPNSSKFLCTGTILEESTADAVVLGVDAGDDVSNASFTGVTVGRVAATYAAFKSTTIKRLNVSGHVYKRAVDTAPAHIFDVPATAVIDDAGLLVQAGAFVTSLSKNGPTASSQIRIAPNALTLFGGSAAVNALAGLWPIVLLDQTTVEYVGALVAIPSQWETFNVFVEHANQGTGTGDVVFRTAHKFATVGENPTTGATTGTPVTVSAGAQYVLAETQLAGPITNVRGKAFVIRVDRRAADAADTLASDYSVAAVVLRRAS